jgi:penicillin-binding protein 1A
MDLTGVFATFANGGKPVKPYAVLEIRRPGGEVLYSHERNAPEPLQAVNPVFVGDLNFMLNQVVLDGTGKRAYLNRTPVAGKTGTTQDYRDAWFLGFTARHVTGVWLGNDDFTPMRRITGGGLPAQTWHDFMVNAERGQEPEPLPGVTVSGQYADAAEEFDDTAALALLEASSRDPVVKVLYNLAGLFRNAQAKSVGTSRYDSFAEFRTDEEASLFGVQRRAPARERTIWNTPNWEGGFR